MFNDQITYTIDDLDISLNPRQRKVTDYNRPAANDEIPNETPEMYMQSNRYTREEIPAGTFTISRMKYGKDRVEVKHESDGGIINRYTFTVLDEEMAEVRYDGNDKPSEVPRYIDYILFDNGIFREHWREHTLPEFSNYLDTLTHVIHTMKVADEGYLQIFAKDIILTEMISLESKLFQRYTMFRKSDDHNAIQETLHEFDNGEFPQSKELYENEGLEYFPFDKSLYDGDVVPQFFTEFTENGTDPPFQLNTRTPESMYDEDKTTDDYISISDLYPTLHKTVEKDSGTFLQVVVLTADGGFFETFQVMGKKTCVAQRPDNDLPSIVCSAFVRENGYEIKNVPTPDEATISQIAQVGFDIVDKLKSAEKEYSQSELSMLDLLKYRLSMLQTAGYGYQNLGEDGYRKLTKQTIAASEYDTVEEVMEEPEPEDTTDIVIIQAIIDWIDTNALTDEQQKEAREVNRSLYEKLKEDPQVEDETIREPGQNMLKHNNPR